SVIIRPGRVTCTTVRKMAENGAFFEGHNAPFRPAPSPPPDRNPLIRRALRPWALAGGRRQIARHFQKGATLDEAASPRDGGSVQVGRVALGEVDHGMPRACWPG